MSESGKFSMPRRDFLQAAAAGAAVSLTPVTAGNAAQPAPATPTPPSGVAPLPAAAQVAEVGAVPAAEVLTSDRPGSDFMVDVIKSLGIEYVCANPGSSFRGLHESLINYGGNSRPELITCLHEESSVAMAHGYAKIEGKPLGVLLHGPNGVQHASMAIYNAYCDRVPVFLIAGNSLDASTRRPGVEWVHSAVDVGAMVRDFVKWDDVPVSLGHFADSAVRGYKIAMTPPMMPVMVVTSHDLQEHPVAPGVTLPVPRLSPMAFAQGDSGAVNETARLLLAAENPVLVADRAARTPAGLQLLVDLAELLQAPVIDRWARLNFPTRHPLNHTDRTRAAIAGADVILGLELTDFWGLVNTFRDQLHRSWAPAVQAGAKLISISSGDLYTKGNFQDLQRYQPVDLAIAADAEATLPSLIEAVRRLMTPERRRALASRGQGLATVRQQLLERARTDASYAWDSSPISTARLTSEIWNLIKDDDWSVIMSEPQFVSNWPQRLWDMKEHHQFTGSSGGYGVGYGAPAAVGAALANKRYGRMTVNIQNDGDLLYAPGVLWTAAHHQIPLLSVMHNNRAYHQETMHVQRMANRAQRGVTRANIGTEISKPDVDFAKLAQSMGVFGIGPITDPAELAPALQKAIAVVRRGEPALVDVVTQPR